MVDRSIRCAIIAGFVGKYPWSIVCETASGKSTIGVALEHALLQLGKRAFRLDGDNVRFGLNKDLGFSEKDRNENIRRIGEVS